MHYHPMVMVIQPRYLVLKRPRTEKGACMSVFDAEAAETSQKGTTVCEELADDCRCMSIAETAEASPKGPTVSEELTDDCRSM